MRSEDEQRLLRAADRTEIQDLMVRYAIDVDTQEAALLDAVFTEDARLDYGAFRGVVSRSEFKEIVAKLSMDATLHLVGASAIEVEGERASARSYFASQHVRLAFAPHHTLFIGGWWDDVLERRAGQWRIVERTVHAHWAQGNPAVMGMSELMGAAVPDPGRDIDVRAASPG
jgi:hypothetical protein